MVDVVDVMALVIWAWVNVLDVVLRGPCCCVLVMLADVELDVLLVVVDVVVDVLVVILWVNVLDVVVGGPLGLRTCAGCRTVGECARCGGRWALGLRTCDAC